jgi:two-component system, NarL family, sensor kinase
MSSKPPLKDANVPGDTQPVLAEMLFAALSEHEAVLARVSRLLHDDVSQVLSAVGLQLDAMRMDFRELAPGVNDRTAEIQRMLEQAIEQLRDISNELNPSIVERAGLHFALERLAGKMGQGFSGVLRLQMDPGARVPTPLAKAFYKIAECAVEDAVTRAGCSLVEVQLKRSHGEFVLEIVDNGAADESESSAQSLARLLMGYHASQNQIALAVRSLAEKGTLVRASHPVADDAVQS